MSFAAGTPVDWTNGSGVFPGGGSITIPADTTRQWFYVQGRDTTEVTVAYAVINPNGSGAGTASISLDPAKAAGGQGGAEERDATIFMPARGQIIVSGTAGKQVTVLTA